MTKNIILINKVFLIFILTFQFGGIKAQSIDDKIVEVYGDINGSFFRGNAELYSQFQILLQNRIKIEQMPYENGEKFIKISSLTINNKYNNTLTHAPFVNTDIFNPLKYNMDFFTKTTKVYRIDNTNLIVVIEPQ